MSPAYLRARESAARGYPRVMRRILPLLVLLTPSLALANGQTTHLWITEQALQALPPGDLKDLLSQPESVDPLLNGSMFPDGGYAVSDDYGEYAHWEPFQQAYLRWIRARFAPDYATGEAALHTAFLMGLVSHGIADEVFDSRFMELSRVLDPGWQDDNAGLDTASDVLLAAQVGGMSAPEPWVPYDVLAQLFVDEIHHDVSVDTIQQGQSLLFTALEYVEWARNTDERVEYFGDLYPWSRDHLLDDAVPGSPPCEGRAVAAAWQATWDRLHERPFDEPVAEFSPGDGSFGLQRDSTRVDARLFATFTRGVEEATLADSVRVLDEAGEEVPMHFHLHYGEHSHALVGEPLMDWLDDAQYTLQVGPGLTDYDGDTFEGSWSASFSTAEPPAEPEPPADEEPAGCDLAGSGASSLALLLPLALRRRRLR